MAYTRLAKDVVITRQAPERVVLENQQFSRWLGRRKGVSAKALSTAMNLLSIGIQEAIAEGYTVRIWGLGTFELREVAPRRRYHRLKREVYLSPANTIVHFKKSENLNTKVRKLAADRLEKLESGPAVSLVGRK